MSYPRSAASIHSIHPLRQGSGLVFVVALHLVVIIALTQGAHIKNPMASIAPVRVLPTVDIPKPPPIPRTPFTPKDIGKVNIPTPELPTVVEQAAEKMPPESIVEQGGSESARRSESIPVVVSARIDPSRPLTQPAYPPASRRNSEEGRVELMLYILANGKVSEAKVAQSSGYSRLDDSAMREALRSWKFIPQQEDGVAVPSWQRFAITFRLNN